MARLLRWALGLTLAVLLLAGAVLVLPFRAWIPGGTVENIPTAQVVNGSAFNRLFPQPQVGERLVFTQEKRGFSEARLKQGDQTMALLAISDTTSAPGSRDKFSQTSSRLQGWPLLEQGPQASALLVADRFQVKVIGQGDGLDPQQRHELISAFDLDGLARLASKGFGKRASAPSLPTGRSVPFDGGTASSAAAQADQQPLVAEVLP